MTKRIVQVSAAPSTAIHLCACVPQALRFRHPSADHQHAVTRRQLWDAAIHGDRQQVRQCFRACLPPFRGVEAAQARDGPDLRQFTLESDTAEVVSFLLHVPVFLLLLGV